MCGEQRELTSSHKKTKKELVCGQKTLLPSGNHDTSEQVLRRGPGLTRTQNGNMENSEKTADPSISHVCVCTFTEIYMYTITYVHAYKYA